MKLGAVSYLVHDYGTAIQWFVDVLGFVLLEDVDMGGGKRWVRVGAAAGGSDLILAQASTPLQKAHVGHVAGGRVGFFMRVDDFAATHARLLQKGVRFREAPRHESYGTVAVFDDLYGNGWDLIGPAEEL